MCPLAFPAEQGGRVARVQFRMRVARADEYSVRDAASAPRRVSAQLRAAAQLPRRCYAATAPPSLLAPHSARPAPAHLAMSCGRLSAAQARAWLGG